MNSFSKKQIVSMFLEPILDPFSKTYYDVITLSTKPIGPLSPFVRCLSLPKLSEFRGGGSRNQYSYVLLRSDNMFQSVSDSCGSFSFSNSDSSCKYMNQDDISDIFSFFVSNGYVIEEALTRVTSRLNHSRQLICMFSYPIVNPIVGP